MLGLVAKRASCDRPHVAPLKARPDRVDWAISQSEDRDQVQTRREFWILGKLRRFVSSDGLNWEDTPATERERVGFNVPVEPEPEFRNGGLSSPDPAIRAKAVGLIKDARLFAKEIGADQVTFCPLGDGYEFAFQYDYALAWKHLRETLAEAGDFMPEIPLFIEYKPSETRGRCFIDSAAKTLCLLNDLKVPSMGVTLDFGHSLYGNENPAEAVALLAESPYRYYVHINDNDGRWDWDYFCGTKHYLDYVEFLYYLKKYGYNDFLTSDTSPTRWDIRGTFEANSRLTLKIWQMLHRIDCRELERRMAAGDYLATWCFVEEEILKAG